MSSFEEDLPLEVIKKKKKRKNGLKQVVFKNEVIKRARVKANNM